MWACIAPDGNGQASSGRKVMEGFVASCKQRGRSVQPRLASYCRGPEWQGRTGVDRDGLSRESETRTGEEWQERIVERRGGMHGTGELWNGRNGGLWLVAHSDKPARIGMAGWQRVAQGCVGRDWNGRKAERRAA